LVVQVRRIGTISREVPEFAAREELMTVRRKRVLP
jgi:hypothetical protein